MVPRIHQSGEERYYGRITKEGSKYLRWISGDINVGVRERLHEQLDVGLDMVEEEMEVKVHI